MTQQTMLELANPFDVQVKELGYGVAMFLFIGSQTCNPSFIVRFYNDPKQTKIPGQLRTVDQNDILVYGNPSAGETLIP